jgi:hypothetical protein
MGNFGTFDDPEWADAAPSAEASTGLWDAIKSVFSSSNKYSPKPVVTVKNGTTNYGVPFGPGLPETYVPTTKLEVELQKKAATAPTLPAWVAPEIVQQQKNTMIWVGVGILAFIVLNQGNKKESA